LHFSKRCAPTRTLPQNRYALRLIVNMRAPVARPSA